MFEVYITRTQNVTVYVDTDDFDEALEAVDASLLDNPLVLNHVEDDIEYEVGIELEPKDLQAVGDYVLLTPKEDGDTVVSTFKDEWHDSHKDDDEEEEDGE